ncbi:uncharacterized protein LOC144150027 isoform X3 [Haemaphysalis longicornis]
MDREPCEESPSCSSERQCRGHKRPRDNSDSDLSSSSRSESSSPPPTYPDSPVPGSDVDSAGSSTGVPLSEEEESLSCSSDSQRRGRKRSWDDSDSDRYSSRRSESSSPPRTHPDSPVPGSDVDSASSSTGIPFSEEDCKGPTENPVAQRKSRGKDKENVGPITLSTAESLSGRFTGQTLNFRLPCTATEDTACQIVGHLSAWNEFFCLAFWKLQEMPGTSAKLSLVILSNPDLTFSSAPERHLAALLVCELLKTHRCVAHVELYTFIFEAQHEILSVALREHPSITSVKFMSYGWINDEELATAALSVPRLQELEYSGSPQYLPTLLLQLSTFLPTTTSLTALRIFHKHPEGLGSEEFFRGLGQNCSLKELVLPSCLIAEAPPCAHAAFTEWLTNSVSLKRLTVASPGWKRVPLKGILRALLANRSIVAVVFDRSKVDPSDVEFVSEVFEENKVLRSFKMSYPLDQFSVMASRPDKANFDRCLKALIENHTLEEIFLPFNIWDEDQWKELFEALPAKRNLKKVNIEAMERIPAFFLVKLCAALKGTGADEKVSFSTSLPGEEFHEWCACKAFSSVFMSATNDNNEALYGLLECMPSLGHITCLSVYFQFINGQDRTPFSVLATFLRATRTLNTLTLGVILDTCLFDYQEILMDGLADNTSLKEVRIKATNMTTDYSTFQEPLADVIKASKNISMVHLSGVGCGGHAFFRRLSPGIADNYTLLSVDVLGYSSFKKFCFKVRDVTRRNCGLLTNALDFTRRARCDRRCALALERMHSHPLLVEEVARVEKVDQARAASMVRDRLRSMEGLHDFMRLAGVVQERVSCHTREDGRTQLDALNEDCWRAVRRYLKLHDIKEEME